MAHPHLCKEQACATALLCAINETIVPAVSGEPVCHFGHFRPAELYLKQANLADNESVLQWMFGTACHRSALDKVSRYACSQSDADS